MIPFTTLPESLGRALDVLTGLTLEEIGKLYKSLRYRWSLWARPKQRLPELGWDVAFFIAGRGGGKTRPGAEWVIEKARSHPKCRIALVGRTSRDVRDTMIFGESGIMACSPPWFKPAYYASKRVLIWPNGAEAHFYTSQEPAELRGPQHHFAWGDEFAAWFSREAYSNLLDGLRLGTAPQVVLTSTPRRLPWFLDAVLGEKNENGVRPVTPEQVKSGEWFFDLKVKDQFGKEITFRTIGRRWSTEENTINLAPGFAAKRRAEYGESSFGRQELDAEILDVVEGALWKLALIDQTRVERPPEKLFRTVVIVDPSHASDGRRDACGLIVVSSGPSPDGKTAVPHAYVRADGTINGTPIMWGRAAVSLYDKYQADAIVYEANETPQRPNLGKSVIGIVDPRKRIRWIPVFSSRDKRTRADPVSGMYEAERVHHVENEHQVNHLAALEEEMVSWDPWDPKAPSPNRVDALVHGVTCLLIQSPDSGMPIPAPISVGDRTRSRM